jgi:diguanylate cyclase (GGDEF)-like protein
MSLSKKIAIFTIVTVILSVGMNGIYFDSFIKKQFFLDVQQKSLMARDIVVDNISDIEIDLENSINTKSRDLIASISLINNYQNKDDYNVFLLDEEKKYIAENLYKKLRSSLNSMIAIYDRNEELISYVIKDEVGYKLYFISYENGKPILYQKYHFEEKFQKKPYKENYYFKHIFFYAPDTKRNFSYHFKDSGITIRSHQNMLEGRDNIAHIEMSKVLDRNYFKNLSTELGVEIYLSQDENLMRSSIPFNKEEIYIEETPEFYKTALSLQTHTKPIYFVIKLDKASLNETLLENRIQSLIFLVISIVLMLAILETILNRNLTTPLKHLMEQIAKVKVKDYSLSKIIRTKDEMEEISRSINSLAKSIRSREDALLESHKQLEYLSTHDELTDLLNRRSFNSKLEEALKVEKELALIFLDLDEFKQVNDTLGHPVGDELLKGVANRLNSLKGDFVLSRVGGDEFNIFLNYKNVIEVRNFAKEILDTFQQPFIFEGNEIVTSTSIGIAIFPDNGKTALSLTKNADLAMYMSKDSGRNNYHFYSKQFSDRLERRAKIVNALKVAITKGDEFFLLYQPKVSIQSRKTVAIETLVRWQSPTLGFIGPWEFIPIAEETHLIVEIGEWILKKAVEDFLILKKEGYNLGQVSVNVSGVQLQHGDMISKVKEILEKTSISSKELELEITESYIAKNEKEAIEVLKILRGLDIDLAIDDFGTGYSSMSYLQKLPVTRLKVDKSFVDELPHSAESIAVVKAVLALAEAFNLNVTVEGVEHEDQLQFFEDSNVDEIQGYYFSKPLPINELREFLDKES